MSACFFPAYAHESAIPHFQKQKLLLHFTSNVKNKTY
jgi:hypothetical protein